MQQQPIVFYFSLYCVFPKTKDIKPPWTAEYWVLRPSLSVAAVGLVTKALAMRYEFRALYQTMAETKFRVSVSLRALSFYIYKY
jgi:hypothetical protein